MLLVQHVVYQLSSAGLIRKNLRFCFFMQRVEGSYFGQDVLETTYESTGIYVYLRYSNLFFKASDFRIGLSCMLV